MKVNFQKSEPYITRICVTCGITFVGEEMVAVLWKDDIEIGYICEDCIKMGPEGLSLLLRKQLQSLRERARVLDELSCELIKCLTWDEYLKELEVGVKKHKEKVLEKARPPRMIMSRVLLIGEDIIPKEEIEGLSPEHIRIFLTELDLSKWPPEILHLKKYVEMNEEGYTFRPND